MDFDEDFIDKIAKDPNYQFVNEKVLFDENLMKEYENLTDNSPQCQPTVLPEATPEETPQEMLDPLFEAQQYVVKDLQDNITLHTIKINQLVHLRVLPKFEEEQNVLVGLYHSHPDYVDRTISGVDPSQPQSINDTR